MKRSIGLLPGGVILSLMLSGCSQAPETANPTTVNQTASAAVQASAPADPQQAAAPAPAAALIEGAEWHHFHINATDPAKSIDYYTRHFKAEPGRFADLMDAVKTQDSWLLFTKVNAEPSTKLNTAIWHIGWGAPDPKNEFTRQQGLGAKFFQELTDISTGLQGFRPDQFYYMYVESPDRTLIELNTARHDNFGHMHLFSADPAAAGEFYRKFFGATGRIPGPEQRAASFSKQGVQVGPSASVNLNAVNIIIYPVEYAKTVYADDWSGLSGFESTRGNVNDHIGISVPDLDKALETLRANGVTVTAEPREIAGRFKFAFIEGPDRIAIELIEEL